MNIDEFGKTKDEVKSLPKPQEPQESCKAIKEESFSFEATAAAFENQKDNEFVQWAFRGDKVTAAGRTFAKLTAGMYFLQSSPEHIFFVRAPINTDDYR